MCDTRCTGVTEWPHSLPPPNCHKNGSNSSSLFCAFRCCCDCWHAGDAGLCWHDAVCLVKACLDDFSGQNIDIATTLLESCGRFLAHAPHTRARAGNILEVM